MRRPLIQRLLFILGAIGAGVLLLGEYIGSINDAVEFITPTRTYVFSFILVLMWLAIEIYLQERPIDWHIPGGSVLRVTRLGWELRFGLAGVIFLLWMPRLIEWSTPQQQLQATPAVLGITVRNNSPHEAQLIDLGDFRIYGPTSNIYIDRVIMAGKVQLDYADTPLGSAMGDKLIVPPNKSINILATFLNPSMYSPVLDQGDKIASVLLSVEGGGVAQSGGFLFTRENVNRGVILLDITPNVPAPDLPTTSPTTVTSPSTDLTASPTVAPLAEDECERARITDEKETVLREEAGRTARPVVTLPTGHEIIVLCDSEVEQSGLKWSRIRANLSDGRIVTGWIPQIDYSE